MRKDIISWRANRYGEMLEYPVPKTSKKSVKASPLPNISEAERELLKDISAGLSNREIARVRNIQVKSCENAISRLAKKLEIPFSPETNQRVLLAKAFEQFKSE